MQGKNLVDAVRMSRPNLAILYMSGYTRNAIVHAGRLDEGVNFLEKPFSPDMLRAKVRKVLDQSTGAMGEGESNSAKWPPPQKCRSRCCLASADTPDYYLPMTMVELEVRSLENSYAHSPCHRGASGDARARRLRLRRRQRLHPDRLRRGLRPVGR